MTANEENLMEDCETGGSIKESLNRRLLMIFETSKIFKIQLNQLLDEAYILSEYVIQKKTDDIGYNKLYEYAKNKVQSYHSASIAMMMLYGILSCKENLEIETLMLNKHIERKYKQRPQMTYIISFVSQLKDKNKKYMEEQEKNIQPQRPIINNIYGTVNNLNNGPVTYQGPVTNNNSAAAPAATPKSAYTDEIVSRAIVALNGDNKPIYEKQLFLGICKVLVCKCGWTGKIPAICDRINGLPIAETLQVKCDYKNLKSPSALKFASLEYDEWEDYEPKDMEKVIFKKNKATADAFAEELDKQLYLSQNQS